MKYIYMLIVILLFSFEVVMANTPAGNGSLKGKVTDGADGSALIGVNLYFPELKQGTVTDNQGNYSIVGLPAIKTTLQVSYLGHQTIVQEVDLKNIKSLDFVLKESDAAINEVVITALTGNSLIKKTPSPISYVSKRDLEETASTNIIDAIAKQPGVSDRKSVV